MPGNKAWKIGIKSHGNNVMAFSPVGIFINHRRTPVHENSNKKKKSAYVLDYE